MLQSPRPSDPALPARAAPHRLLPIAVFVALAGAPARDAAAMCNVIPGATAEFRGAVGALNRPFASPGDFVRIRVRPSVCDTGSTGFVDLEGGSVRSDDYVVTVLFDPPASEAQRHAVVLAQTCPSQLQLDGCAAALGLAPGEVPCVADTAAGLVVPDDSNLSFRFPDTDGQLGGPADDRTLTGPAKLVVTRLTETEPLPCALAATRCADATGVVACVDELYEIDGTCRTDVARIDPVFPGFTALPPPNDFQAMSVAHPPEAACTVADPEVHFTVDKQGNALVPIDWSGVRVFLDGVPVARLVRGTTDIPADQGGAPVNVPAEDFLSSYSPEGIRLPPIFTPIANPSSDPQVPRLALFGTIDAPRGVSRIARRTCEGGSNAGNSCDEDGDCSGGQCSTPLFEFRGRLDSGVGPVVIGSSNDPTSGCYTAKADTPVPLDGLLETPDVFAFAVDERIQNTDLNLDADAADLVMTLGDRDAGLGINLSAVVRVREPPFSFAAIAAEDDVVAYLEAEPHEGNVDASDDGDVADTILRVYRSSPSGANELTSGANCADAEPLIDGRPLAISQGLVFFRTPEASCARRITERVSIDESGAVTDGNVPDTDVLAPSIMQQALSGDGIRALWMSTSGPPGAAARLLLRDRALRTTTWVSRDSLGGAPNASVGQGHLSADGSTVVFLSEASDIVEGTPADGVPRIFVHDVGGTTSPLGVPDPGGHCPGLFTTFCNRVNSLSADGQLVVFHSNATNLPGASTSNSTHIYLHHHTLGTTLLVDQTTSGIPFQDSSISGAVSADGARVAFEGDGGFAVFVRDRDTDGDGIFDESGAVSTTRVSGLEAAFAPSISPDGRYVSFRSRDPSLVPGDTNDDYDIFVHDLKTGLTERVNVSSEALQAEGGPDFTTKHSLSRSGRFVVFESNDTNLVAGDTNREQDVFVHDRLTGITQRVSLHSDGSEPGPGPLFGRSSGSSLSWDGQTAFLDSSADLDADPAFGLGGVFVRGPDSSDLETDLTGDGDLGDTVLRVLDTRSSQPQAVPLGPAGAVSVAGDAAAFLLPESATGVDQNGDQDLDDAFVQLSVGGTAAEDLGREAVAIALSPQFLAALVPSASGTNFVQVYDRAQRTWTPQIGPEASALQIAGSVVAFVAAAEDQLHVYDAATDTLTPVGQPALDFVLGDRLVAFRTRECDGVGGVVDASCCSAGGTDRNSDGDPCDDVLEVYDFHENTDQLLPTGQAATPCDLEACDPRIPYRVSGEVVTFLTREEDQGNQDLDGDGDSNDIVVQTFNARKAIAVAAAQAGALLARVGSGLCLDSGEACSTDADCGATPCFLPPGRCVVPGSTACDLDNLSTGCSGDSFCLPNPGSSAGTCHTVVLDAQANPVTCQGRADCTSGAFCIDAEQDFQRLVGPVSATSNGEQLFTSKEGLCLEVALPAVLCPQQSCSPSQLCEQGQCQIPRDSCSSDSDCPPGVACHVEASLVVVAADDVDGDGVADPLDNCPGLPNVGQVDGDSDGIGDTCDRATCGDGVQTYQEGCDDGSQCQDGTPCTANADCTAIADEICRARDGDACDSACQPEGIACADGVDSDGDGKVDYPADPGCTSASDSSERQTGKRCDDGIDNDGDELVDFPSDPGCRTASSKLENPRCDNGIDDDGDGGIDWDGGGVGPADPQCVGQSWHPREASACGLGFELALLLPPLLWLRRRRRRRPPP